MMYLSAYIIKIAYNVIFGLALGVARPFKAVLGVACLVLVLYPISDYSCIFLVLLCLIPSYPLCHPILFVLSLSSLVFGFDFVVLGVKKHSHTTEKSLYLLVFQRFWLVHANGCFCIYAWNMYKYT